ncbi:hypothetical protein FQA39_LY05255 [Lamprigera yunnana]|nr:hypothetical protein FQA39_LY05255 [Lamprigera yunnana]
MTSQKKSIFSKETKPFVRTIITENNENELESEIDAFDSDNISVKEESEESDSGLFEPKAEVFSDTVWDLSGLMFNEISLFEVERTSKNNDSFFENGMHRNLVGVLNYILAYLLKYDLLYAELTTDDPFTKIFVSYVIKIHYFGIVLILISESIVKYVSDDSYIRPTRGAALFYTIFFPVYLYQFAYQVALESGERTSKDVDDKVYVHVERERNEGEEDGDQAETALYLLTNFIELCSAGSDAEFKHLRTSRDIFLSNNYFSKYKQSVIEDFLLNSKKK